MPTNLTQTLKPHNFFVSFKQDSRAVQHAERQGSVLIDKKKNSKDFVENEFFFYGMFCETKRVCSFMHVGGLYLSP